jgi:hypothetical protein
LLSAGRASLDCCIFTGARNVGGVWLVNRTRPKEKAAFVTIARIATLPGIVGSVSIPAIHINSLLLERRLTGFIIAVIFHSTPKAITFEDAKSVLLVVLAEVGEEFWHRKLVECSSDSFKAILGGMGSFNDLFICSQNNHRITDEKEPQANELLSCLTSVCYVTSQRGSVQPSEAVAACGTEQLVISGWRCLSCGYSQTSRYNIRAFIAAGRVRDALGIGIDQVLKLWIQPEDAKAVQDWADLAEQSKIHVTEDESWMRPCPSCGGNDTGVYRWEFKSGSFIPGGDNLPIRPECPQRQK